MSSSSSSSPHSPLLDLPFLLIHRICLMKERDPDVNSDEKTAERKQAFRDRFLLEKRPRETALQIKSLRYAEKLGENLDSEDPKSALNQNPNEARRGSGRSGYSRRRFAGWRCDATVVLGELVSREDFWRLSNAATIGQMKADFLRWIQERCPFETFLGVLAKIAGHLLPLGFWAELEEVLVKFVTSGTVLSMESHCNSVSNILIIICIISEYLLKSYTDVIPEHLWDCLIRKLTELANYSPLGSCYIIHNAARASIPVIVGIPGQKKLVIALSQEVIYTASQLVKSDEEDEEEMGQDLLEDLRDMNQAPEWLIREILDNICIVRIIEGSRSSFKSKDLAIELLVQLAEAHKGFVAQRVEIFLGSCGAEKDIATLESVILGLERTKRCLPVEEFQEPLEEPFDIDSVPEFSSFGKLFKSSPPVELTEAEAENGVNVVKHIFDRHVVFQYNCNPDQLLENVSVIVEASKAEKFTEVSSKPLRSLQYDSPGQTFVAFEKPDGVPSVGKFSNTLKFVVKEVANGDIGEGRVEDYKLEDLEVVSADYVLKVGVSDFRKAWESMGPEDERVGEYGLGARESLAEAVNTVIGLLGMKPCEGTEVVPSNLISHTCLLSGVHMRNVKVLVRLSFGVDGPKAVAMDLAVRSKDESVRNAILKIVASG